MFSTSAVVRKWWDGVACKCDKIERGLEWVGGLRDKGA